MSPYCILSLGYDLRGVTSDPEIINDGSSGLKRLYKLMTLQGRNSRATFPYPLLKYFFPSLLHHLHSTTHTLDLDC